MYDRKKAVVCQLHITCNVTCRNTEGVLSIIFVSFQIIYAEAIENSRNIIYSD